MEDHRKYISEFFEKYVSGKLGIQKKRCKITSLEIDAETTEAVVILFFFSF